MPEAMDRPAAARTVPDLMAALRGARIVIEDVSPCVDGGLFPAKAVVGQAVEVAATIYMDGHDVLAAQLRWWPEGEAGARSVPLQALGNDRWRARFVPQQTGLHRYTFDAWLDVWGSFRNELFKKHAAGQPLHLEIEEGRALVLSTAWRAPDDTRLGELARRLPLLDEQAALGVLLADTTREVMAAAERPRFMTTLETPLPLDVERVQAGFASWYELFPRSQTDDPDRHGTFDDVIGRLPMIRAMGFDVLYFPPIHPIGTTHRKGRNNSLRAQPGDPGSPYAIGSAEGGHDAVEPLLGGIESFRRLRAACADQGIELALDLAVQCSPDHPWLDEHPGWFSWRADGTIRHAENPPKKYEDIVNVDFYADEAQPSLWLALRNVVQGWIDEGVRIFRVDNPHTKPLPFWQWLITDIRARDPDVIFLAEAFTKPAMMYRLAKIGFTQSYTYFTWRNTKQELTEYLLELTQRAPKDFYRPHFFVNTPDINPYFLQTSGRSGFLIRAALAATLSGLWGMYSGFELCEAAALPGKEEYLDSEKYQLRPRNWNAPGNIVREIARLNQLRKRHPELQTHLGLRFYTAWNEQVLYYGKPAPDVSSLVLVLVNLDPHQPQATHFEAPLWEFGLPDDAALEVEDLLYGSRFTWHGKVQHWYFELHQPYTILRVQPAR